MNVRSKNISKNIWRELRKSRTFFSGFLSVSISLRYCCQTSMKLEGGLLLQRLIPRNKIQRLSRIQTKISAPMRKSRKSSCRSTSATAPADFVQVAGKAEKRKIKDWTTQEYLGVSTAEDIRAREHGLQRGLYWLEETGDTWEATGPVRRNCRCCRGLGGTFAEKIWETQNKLQKPDFISSATRRTVYYLF